MRASGCFRFVRDMALHHVDAGGWPRYVGLLRSQGGVMDLLKAGYPESDLGISRARGPRATGTRRAGTFVLLDRAGTRRGGMRPKRHQLGDLTPRALRWNYGATTSTVKVSGRMGAAPPPAGAGPVRAVGRKIRPLRSSIASVRAPGCVTTVCSVS